MHQFSVNQIFEFNILRCIMYHYVLWFGWNGFTKLRVLKLLKMFRHYVPTA